MSLLNNASIGGMRITKIITVLVLATASFMLFANLTSNNNTSAAKKVKEPAAVDSCYKWGATNINNNRNGVPKLKESDFQNTLGVHWFANWSMWTSLPSYDDYFYDNGGTSRQHLVQFRPTLDDITGEPKLNIAARLAEARAKYPHDTLEISVGNELDIYPQGNMTPAEYADAYYKYHTIIKSIDSNTSISAGGFTTGGLNRTNSQYSSYNGLTGLAWYEEFRKEWASDWVKRSYSQSINGTNFPPTESLDIHLYTGVANINNNAYGRDNNAAQYLQDVYSYMDAAARPELNNRTLIISEVGMYNHWARPDSYAHDGKFYPDNYNYMRNVLRLIDNDDRVVKALWFSSDLPNSSISTQFTGALFDNNGNLTRYGEIFRYEAGGCFGEFDACSLGTDHAECTTQGGSGGGGGNGNGKGKNR